MPMMYGYNWSWGGMLLMMLNWLIWFGLLGLLLWALLRWIGRRAPNQQIVSGQSANEILSQRYARGEIDEPTFERMRQQLDSPAAREPLSIPPGR